MLPTTSDSQSELLELKGSARKLGNEIMSSIIDAIDRRREDLLRKKPKLNEFVTRKVAFTRPASWGRCRSLQGMSRMLLIFPSWEEAKDSPRWSSHLEAHPLGQRDL